MGIADWELWRDVRLAALREAPYAFGSSVEEWPAGGEARWRGRLELAGSYNLVAVLDDEPVGIASGVPGDHGGCELRSVWVSPLARGNGLGGKLIAEVEGWARETGATVLRLSVLAGNDAAIELYRRSGFVDSDEALLDDGLTRMLFMVKSLH